METEIEAKFLNIDPDGLRAKLEEAGGALVHPERLMGRRNFDYPDGRLEKAGGWVRIRDEGDKITLSYKQVQDRTLHGTKEVAVDVSNFEATGSFLEAIGLAQKSYQETKRERWLLGEVEVAIDTWPWIPPFVELEGPSAESVRSTAEVLGLDWSEARHGSVETAYQAVYGVTEDEINAWEVITFTPVPDWLQKDILKK